MANQTITEEQKKAIAEYGSKIQTMKDFVSIARLRPGQFIGPLHTQGFLNMIREIFQNGVDQLMDPISPCNWIALSYDMRTLEVSVEDNGLSIPFDDMVRIFTKQYTSKNYTKKIGEYSSGLNGIGAKIVNALSDYMIIESYHYDGKAMKLITELGYPTTNKPVSIPNKDKKQGAKITFKPSIDVLGDVELDWTTLYDLVKHIISIAPIGSVTEFTAIDMNGKKHYEKIVNTDGIITDLIMKVKSPINKPIIVSEDDGTHKLEAAFCFDSAVSEESAGIVSVTSFSNFCPTRSGTHVDGTVDGICRWFVNYMNKIYLINQKAKDKTVVIANDIKNGLNIMIAAAHIEPEFDSQSKTHLSNPDMEPFCRQVVMKGLDAWSKANPQDLAKLSRYFKDLADIRMKSEKEKVKITTKYVQNSITGLPSKYARPTERNYEFIIVEGDSAGGSAKVGRDEKCQGIFPIRGKIPSAYEKTKQEFWNNAETQGIARIILGKDYYRHFDPNKDVEWDKIIFMADGDVDGAHISTLLLRFFILYMPQLIEAGKVYKALPPLYSTTSGKKITYLTDQLDFVRFVQKNFIQNNVLNNISTKKQLSGKDMTVLFMTNEDYVHELESTAITFGVEPGLLEMALLNYINSTSFAMIKKDLKNKYRFMNVSKEKNTLVYDGTIKESNFLFMNDRLIHSCQKIINIMKKNIQLYYLMNGQPCTLYEIMKAFDNSAPSNIQRYKGLGEMGADQIAVSTLRPDSDRTLIRYTLNDAKEEMAAIREFESDRSKLLDFVGTVKRSDLME